MDMFFSLIEEISYTCASLMQVVLAFEINALLYKFLLIFFVFCSYIFVFWCIIHMCIYVRGLDSFEKKSTRKCLLISLVFEKMEYLVLLQNGLVVLFTITISWKLITYMWGSLKMEKEPMKVLVTGAAGMLAQPDSLFGFSWSLLEIFDCLVIIMKLNIRNLNAFYIIIYLFLLNFWNSHLNFHSNWQIWMFSKW